MVAIPVSLVTWAVSGGFATVNPDSTMQISAMEAFPVDQLDPKAVSDGLAEASRRMASSPSNEAEKAEALIHHSIYQAMSNAIQKTITK